MSTTEVVCSGCGARVDAVRALPFRCPAARDGDGIDHVLVRAPIHDAAVGSSSNPFIRYRRRLLAYQVAVAGGMPDDAFCALVEDLDRAVMAVDGVGFRVTPLRRCAEADSNGLRVWLKDETGNVAGSHKARHLFGVMLYLRIAETLGLPPAAGLRQRPLAIASCGNAALAAAVVARAAAWPIDVFIPTDADPAVVRKLESLGARIHVEVRQSGVAGDPCVHAFRRAVAAGALPFGVQGNENGLAVEGGRTLAYEIAEAMVDLRHVFVQVGGGALGSALYGGLAESMPRLPVFHTVQTRGAFPLKRAYDRYLARFGASADADSLQAASRDRAAFMWPWEETPHSVAHGILDDETYDWHALVEAMVRTGGSPIVVGEQILREARDIAVDRLGLAVSHTGSAGFAGLLQHIGSGAAAEGDALALMTGVAR